MILILNDMRGLEGTGTAGFPLWGPTYKGNAVAAGTVCAHGAFLYTARVDMHGGPLSLIAPDQSPLWRLSGLDIGEPQTNAPRSIYDGWSPLTDYAAAANVFDRADESDYRCLVAHAKSSIRPSQAVVSSDPTIARRWRRIGAANAWAMFDGRSSKKTIGHPGENLVCTFQTTHACNRIALFGLSGVDQISVAAIGGGTTTLGPGFMAHSSAYGGYRSRAVVAMSGTATRFVLTLRLASGYPWVECGVVAAGTPLYLGQTGDVIRPDLLDFSNVERDDFGYMQLVRRGYASEVPVDILVEMANTDAVVARLTQVRAVPCVYDLNENTAFDQLILWGVHQGVQPTYARSGHGVLSLVITSMVED